MRIFEELLNQTTETLRKIQGRSGIDATDIQLKQAETSLMVREAALVRARTRVRDAQDNLLRLAADPQLNLLTDVEIVPTTAPMGQTGDLDVATILRAAMADNPVLEQARVALDMADLNVRVADNQRMPRLDLVGSARTQGLAEEADEAHDPLGTGQYLSYAVGLSLEVPLGNRQREAVLQQRRIERRRAVASLTEVADDVALFAKERIRRVETSSAEITIHKQAEAAAYAHLEALERAEEARQRLTPEFLLVKLQAQESLADARGDLAEAIAQFNISLSALAQATGTVLELHGIRAAATDLDSP
jgi:outer membrane protein TolC